MMRNDLLIRLTYRICFWHLMMIDTRTIFVQGYSCSRCSSGARTPPFSVSVKLCDEFGSLDIDVDGNPLVYRETPDVTARNACECCDEDPCFPSSIDVSCTAYSGTLETDPTCDSNDLTFGSAIVEEEICGDVCRCVVDPPIAVPDDICPPGKCDITYQCASVLYVCWNVVDPDDIGLDDNALYPGLSVVNFIDDSNDNTFKSNPDDPFNCCSSITANMDANNGIPTADIIDSCFTCSGVGGISRITKFCTPDNGVDGIYPLQPYLGEGCKENVVGDCSLAFCDYQGNEFALTQFSLEEGTVVELDAPSEAPSDGPSISPSTSPSNSPSSEFPSASPTIELLDDNETDGEGGGFGLISLVVDKVQLTFKWLLGFF